MKRRMGKGNFEALYIDVFMTRSSHSSRDKIVKLRLCPHIVMVHVAASCYGITMHDGEY